MNPSDTPSSVEPTKTVQLPKSRTKKSRPEAKPAHQISSKSPQGVLARVSDVYRKARLRWAFALLAVPGPLLCEVISFGSAGVQGRGYSCMYKPGIAKGSLAHPRPCVLLLADEKPDVEHVLDSSRSWCNDRRLAKVLLTGALASAFEGVLVLQLGTHGWPALLDVVWKKVRWFSCGFSS